MSSVLRVRRVFVNWGDGGFETIDIGRAAAGR